MLKKSCANQKLPGNDNRIFSMIHFAAVKEDKWPNRRGTPECFCGGAGGGGGGHGPSVEIVPWCPIFFVFVQISGKN